MEEDGAAATNRVKLVHTDAIPAWMVPERSRKTLPAARSFLADYAAVYAATTHIIGLMGSVLSLASLGEPTQSDHNVQSF